MDSTQPIPQGVPSSEYNQSSFVGGFSLLGDDTYLQPNQYRIGFNLTNRYGSLDLIPSSLKDTSAPQGPKQAIATFGNYVILFCAGSAYYRFYSQLGWTKINGFAMSQTALRYWTIAIPVSTTNYVRLSATGSISTSSNPAGIVQLAQVAGAAGGNLPGLLVQDNINQPQFIFLDINGVPTVRITQTFAQWSITFTDASNVTVTPNGDQREYVPIGNFMAWDSGVLYVVDQTFNFIYRSVSGRPLDFVVNVSNNLVTMTPFKMTGGGDASTTAYSVGVGGISCIRTISSGGIFVSASGANFSVTQNRSQNAPTEFGEYTFIRTFLFNSFCLSDRAIFDSIGDTRFIDLTGIRSFNAVAQLQNEGRNSPFSATVQGAFLNENKSTIVQDSLNSAATLFDNYELYSVNTIFGPAIIKYDTINGCWVSFDVSQVTGFRIRQFAPLQINVLALFAITEDDNVYQLYADPVNNDVPSFRSVGITTNLLYANYNIKMNNPKDEVKLLNTRLILNGITENGNVSFTAFVNNRLSPLGKSTKNITYTPPSTVLEDQYSLPDVNTQLSNVMFSVPNSAQGWKVFGVYSWTQGSLTQFSMELERLSPMNPMTSQINVS